VLLTASSETICEGQSTTISATGANTYSWNQNLSNISSHVVSPNINTTYTVTGTSVHGCTGTASMLITVYENPIITVIAQPDGVCPGDTVFVSASGADTYQWNTGQTANSFQTPLFSSTTFVVTATDQNGCSATNQVFVQAFDSLQASINPINPSICLGDSMLLTVNSIGTSNQYLWNTGDTLPSIIVSPDTASSYVVTVTSPFGCIETTVTNVTVYPIPQVDFVASPTYGCVPVTVNFTNLSEQGSYVWNFGDGNTSAVANPSHTYNQHGQFTVQLTVTANNCDNSAIRYNYIDIYPKPIASFQVSSNIVYEDEPTIDFSDNSSGATSWFWNFGDGTGFSDNQHEQYTYGTVGSYQVWLIVENLWGCKDSTSQQVVVKPLVTFFIPNSFSPNADGMNDFFMPVGNNIDIENYEFSIFDRYGKRVFYTTDIQTAWDGRIHNNEIKSGVYIYDITVKLEGKTRKYRGSVLVLL
jgi:gliding motility-associated-like protein